MKLVGIPALLAMLMRPVLSVDFIQASFTSTFLSLTCAMRLSFIVVMPCRFDVCMIEEI